MILKRKKQFVIPYRNTLRRHKISEKISYGDATLLLASEINHSITSSANNQVEFAITNLSNFEMTNLVIQANMPNGASLVVSDQLFGTAFKQEKLRKLSPKQTIRYRINLKVSKEFRSGVAVFSVEVDSNFTATAKNKYQIELPLIQV